LFETWVLVTTWDIIGMVLDMDTNTIKWYKNNSLIYTINSIVQDTYSPVAASASGVSWYIINFGQWWQSWLQDCAAAWGKFKYCPPVGFKALSTKNLPEPIIKDPSKHFDVLTYTGNWSSQSIGWLEFKPDFVWMKSRNVAHEHWLVDSVRGWNKFLYSDQTTPEWTDWWTTYFTEFISDWLNINWWWTAYNNSWDTYVAWNWKAGWAAVTNTDWSITSQVSANVDAGFSIVGYTGNWVAGATVGHWLSKEPEMVWIKNRDWDWASWVVQWNTWNFNKDSYMYLNMTRKEEISTAFQIELLPKTLKYWNIHWINNDRHSDWQMDKFIAYAFHSVPWYSKVWSYTGNGSADWTFVYTGFKPRYVMIKRTDSADNWDIRVSSDLDWDHTLRANLYNAESWSDSWLDYLSNWFKLKQDWISINSSWWKYIYIAFAEAPFKYANAR